MNIATPGIAIELVEIAPQVWEIQATVWMVETTYGVKIGRKATQGEVEVVISKELTLTNPEVGRGKTDAYGLVTINGRLTDGYYVIVATHLATGKRVKGTIMCPKTGTWSYSNPVSGPPWYPTEEMP